MEEYSRILIERYCRKNNSAKSRRLAELVEMSYDIAAEYTDDDAIFMEKVIRQEKDKDLREELKDLDHFMSGYYY